MKGYRAESNITKMKIIYNYSYPNLFKNYYQNQLFTKKT